MPTPPPLTIPPGLAPDGVVVHVYGLPGWELLTTEFLTPGTNLDESATAAAGRIDLDEYDGLALAYYDGDSGHIMEPPEVMGR